MVVIERNVIRLLGIVEAIPILRESATVLRYTYSIGLVHVPYHRLFVSRGLLVLSVNGWGRFVQ